MYYSKFSGDGYWFKIPALNQEPLMLFICLQIVLIKNDLNLKIV